MANYHDKEWLYNKISLGQDFVFQSAEEYFFLLGQLVMYVFARLGGIQHYTKEFNYLTNPYLPQNVQELANRMLRFLSKQPSHIIDNQHKALAILQVLRANQKFYCDAPINIQTCTEALFEGLHKENIFIELDLNQQSNEKERLH